MDYYSFGSPYGYDPAYEAELEARDYEHRLRVAQAQAQEAAAREEAFRRAHYKRQQQQQHAHSHWPYGMPAEEPWTADSDDDSAFAIPTYGFDGRPSYTYGEEEPLPEHIYRRPSPPLSTPLRRPPSSSFQQSRESKLPPPNVSTSNLNSHSRPSSRRASPVPSPSYKPPAAATTSKPVPPAGPSPAEQVAARRVQRFWRTRSGIRRKLADLKAVEQEFHRLQAEYVAPSSPVVDPKTGKLAYCKENNAVHAYVDSLEKLQVKLDGVDSNGHQHIRDFRKTIIVAIEKELQQVERWKAEVISKAQQQQQQQRKVDAPSSTQQTGEKDEYGFEDLSHESEDAPEHVW